MYRLCLTASDVIGKVNLTVVGASDGEFDLTHVKLVSGQY